MEILAIIPARSGSKGLINKNIKLFHGHPLLAFSIAAGIQTNEINRTICSTDCPKIAQIAKQYNAEIPFLRPQELAQDNSLDIEVFQHILTELQKKEGYIPDLVVNLRPTSPLRSFKIIKEAIEILRTDSSITSVRSITKTIKSPYKIWFKSSLNIIDPILRHQEIVEAFNAPRQSLPTTYEQTATIDIVRSSVIESGSMSGSKIFGMEIEKQYVTDIDTLIDFKQAEEEMGFTPNDYIFPEN